MSEEPAPVAKKRGRKPKASITDHMADDTGIIPPKPPHDYSMGEKTPAIIRWRLKYHPETMAATYRNWDWQAWLDLNPE
jgi:hypothetical protein